MTDTILDNLFISNIKSYIAEGNNAAKAQAWLNSAADKVNRGGDVNARDENGETMLHVAARSGSTLLARFILDLGADATARTPDGLTPPELATEMSMVGVLPILQAAYDTQVAGVAPVPAAPETSAAAVQVTQALLRRAAPKFRL